MADIRYRSWKINKTIAGIMTMQLINTEQVELVKINKYYCMEFMIILTDYILT